MPSHTLLLRSIRILGLGLMAAAPFSVAPDTASKAPAFKVIVLGAGGGLDESNLSCYLVSAAKENRFVALDAGTLLTGIRKAEAAGSFGEIPEQKKSGLSLPSWLLKEGIKAYLISHAHFDHTSGMIINSPDDGAKTIIGLDNTIDDLRDHVFNNRSWINFTTEGENALKRYTLIRAKPGEVSALSGTSMKMRALPLSHSNRGSTAYLLESEGEFLLYFGDTGPDEIEKSDQMQRVWKEIGPIIKAGKLRGIFLEISYSDERPDNMLFSHLTPKWFMTEMHALARTVDPAKPSALKDLRVVVTHIKPSINPRENHRKTIQSQLEKRNDLGLRLIFAEQGQRLLL